MNRNFGIRSSYDIFVLRAHYCTYVILEYYSTTVCNRIPVLYSVPGTASTLLHHNTCYCSTTHWNWYWVPRSSTVYAPQPSAQHSHPVSRPVKSRLGVKSREGFTGWLIFDMPSHLSFRNVCRSGEQVTVLCKVWESIFELAPLCSSVIVALVA